MYLNMTLYFCGVINKTIKMQYSKFIILISIFGLLSCADQDPIIEYVAVTETVIKTETILKTVEVSVNPYTDSTFYNSDGTLPSN